MNSRKNRGETNIVVVVIVVVAIVGLAAFLAIHYVTSQYDAGTYETGKYTNKWSKVQVEIPSDFTKTEKHSNSAGELRLFATKDGSCMLGIGTLKGKLSVDEAMDVVKKDITSTLSIYGSLYNASITSRPYTDVTIAGKSYRCLPIEIRIGATTIYYNYYCHKVNRNGVMFFVTSGRSQADVDRALSLIKKYK